MRAVDGLFPTGLQRVLAPVMLNPEREFRHTELVRRAGPGRGAGQNAVWILLNTGLAVSRRSGNQVLISANRSHPLFPEIRSICVKSFGVADRIRDALAPWKASIRHAFMFGSVVTGTDRPGSDVDLIVVGDVDLLSLHAAVEGAEQEIGRPVHVSVYGSGEWARRQQEPVVASIVAGPKVTVVGEDVAA